MNDRTGMLRVAALLLVGVLAVHELRYVIAFGGDAGRRWPITVTGI